MLSIVLTSIVVVAVVFAVVNKFTKKQEQPIEQPTIVEEPLGYETSSLAAVEEIVNLPVAEVIEEPKPKTKKKMSAKPKAPKKKKNA